VEDNVSTINAEKHKLNWPNKGWATKTYVRHNWIVQARQQNSINLFLDSFLKNILLNQAYGTFADFCKSYAQKNSVGAAIISVILRKLLRLSQSIASQEALS